MKQILSLALAFLLIATSAQAYNEPAAAAGTNGAIQYNNNGALGGLTAQAAQNTIYGFPNFRAKLANIKRNSGVARVCFAGDSTFFGSWSNNANSGDLTGHSMPTQVANLLSSTYGIKANRNGFIGDGGPYETFGANDSRIVIGGWAQDSAIISLGGRTFKTTTVAGTPLTFTPTSPVNTFRFGYITQSGGGTLQAQIDNETPVTYNTAGSSGLVFASLASSTAAAGTHTIKFTMSAGAQINFDGVSDAWDSANASVDIVNMGWAGAKITDQDSNTAAYSPASPTAWAALGCDLAFMEDGINDWNAGTTSAAYQPMMQAWVASAQASTTDVAIVTPVPSPNAPIALQNSYISAMYTIANALNVPVLDTYTRWGSNANAHTLGLMSTISTVHPNAAGYAEEAFSISSSLAAVPGQAANPLAFLNTLGFGSLQATSFISTGTTFTTSGCAVSATTGGATAGTYTSGTTGSCTTVINTGLASTNGWACSASDRTTTSDIITQTASTTTTATLAGPTNSGDVISFYCMGY